MSKKLDPKTPPPEAPQAPAPPQTPAPMPPGITPVMWAGIGGAFILIVAVGLAIGYFAGQSTDIIVSDENINDNNQHVTDVPKENPVGETQAEKAGINVDQEVTEIHGDAIVLDDIAWQEYVDDENPFIFDATARDGFMDRLIGVVNTGEYAGYEVHIATLVSQGMGSGNLWTYLEKDGAPIVVQKYSAETGKEYWANESLVSYTVDYRVSIPEIEAPAHVKTPEGIVLERQSNRVGVWGNVLFSEFEDLIPLFIDDQSGFEVFQEKVVNSAAFFVKLPDGTLAKYKYRIPFQSDAGTKVTLNGEPNFVSYTSVGIGGCGPTSYQDVVLEDQLDRSDLKKIGEVTHSLGTKLENTDILGFKIFKHPMLSETFEMRASGYEVTTGEELSYGDFLDLTPLFFWEDPFGRLVRFTHPSLQPIAECGKPVIYLYPEETTDVSVQVAPNGGFTLTEPEYGRGWNVTAEPNGQLTNLSDGTQWSYLFWEGHAETNIATERRGFVVAPGEVEEMLEEKLSALGLQGQEIADFTEFWVPKMQRYPYYFVTFYTNEFLDSGAPLKVDPQPDTIIRIMMDYKPLMREIDVEPLPIVTPERNGFTVVEWGGVLRK